MADIPKTMTAATIVGFNEPIQILRDVPVPELPDDKILVKVESASLCSSDLMAYKGYMSFMTTVPYCGGHEPVGVIAKVGPSVKGFSVGDRVGFIMFHDACGICPDCFAGQHRYCSEKKIMGFKDTWGGFSEYALADPISTVKLPDGLSFDVAAPLFCAGITAYSALLKVKSHPGQLINIIGCGGVGHLVILFAKAMGFRVHAYDVSDSKVQLALECGADKAFNSLTYKEAPEQAPSTLVVSGAGAAYNSSLAMTSNHGVILGIGLPAEGVNINVPLWGSKGVTFVPCNVGSRAELAEALDLAVRHNIKPLLDIRHIDTINDGYRDLAEGKIDGRIVYHFH